MAVHFVSAKSKPIRAMSARKKEVPKADEINFALPLPSQIGVGKSTRKDENQQAPEKGVRDATELRASSITEAEGIGQPASSSRQLEGP